MMVSITFALGNSFLHPDRLFVRWICRLYQSPSPRGTHFYPLPHFLLILCGFPASIFGVFSRQFWKRLFFGHFSIFKYFLWKGRIRGARISINFGFLPVLAASFQTYGFISTTQYDRRSTLLTPCGFYSADLLSLPRCIQQTFMRPMYVGRPSVSADSGHSSALIAQMQATAYTASFSSSHPGDSTPDTKPRTSSVLCAAAAYRYLIGDSICNFQSSHITILTHRAALIHQRPSLFFNNHEPLSLSSCHCSLVRILTSSSSIIPNLVSNWPLA